jgi:hypothetical protein
VKKEHESATCAACHRSSITATKSQFHVPLQADAAYYALLASAARRFRRPPWLAPPADADQSVLLVLTRSLAANRPRLWPPAPGFHGRLTNGQLEQGTWRPARPSQGHFLPHHTGITGLISGLHPRIPIGPALDSLCAPMNEISLDGIDDLTRSTASLVRRCFDIDSTI